ncbi:Las1-like-domain-containing protein [Lipomyces orientalis]|uniref:Las1-like-domain-containing protein n=1 Tax=Lipomyces orientalis TaxID=1233043 RepID=A0ACC3TYR8_9ASCO
MSRHPRSVAYRDLAELEQLYSWFYDSLDERPKAISLVEAYNTRGHVPYGIECTALLISSILLDAASAAQEQTLALRLAYSSSVIRFVNGFLDPHQTTQFAMPLHALALKIGMPTMFVELRHACTHESLPSLAVLRHAAKQAVEWLRSRYWIPEIERLRDAQNGRPSRVVESIEEWIKTFGTEDLDVVSDDGDDDGAALEVTLPNFAEVKYKSNSSSANGRAYWRLLKVLAQLSEQEREAFSTVGVDIIFSHGIRKDTTSCRSLKLFSPLLQYIAPAVTEALLKRCLQEVVNSYKTTDEPVYIPSLQPSTPEESASIIYLGRDKNEPPILSHARNWIQHILSHTSSTSAEQSGKAIHGFSISYSRFVALCLRLSTPTPTLLDFLKLAKKHCSSSRNDPVNELVDNYANQVGILYTKLANGNPEKKRKRAHVDELDRTVETIEKKTEKLAQYRRELKRATAATLAHDEDKKIKSWTLLDGSWSARPIGVL